MTARGAKPQQDNRGEAIRRSAGIFMVIFVPLVAVMLVLDFLTDVEVPGWVILVIIIMALMVAFMPRQSERKAN